VLPKGCKDQMQKACSTHDSAKIWRGLKAGRSRVFGWSSALGRWSRVRVEQRFRAALSDLQTGGFSR
jgi:hypothetical protein